MGVLTVKVIKATNLADKDFVGKTDPYVEITLEQDNMVRVVFFNVLFVCFVDFRESHVVRDVRSWFYVLTPPPPPTLCFGLSSVLIIV